MRIISSVKARKVYEGASGATGVATSRRTPREVGRAIFEFRLAPFGSRPLRSSYVPRVGTDRGLS